jgi:hypothetical protein
MTAGDRWLKRSFRKKIASSADSFRASAKRSNKERQQMTWEDLSDAELRERLKNRGYDGHVASILVNNRDHDDERFLITRLLDEGDEQWQR